MTAPVFKPAGRPGLFRRTPPAIFPPILGLFGLGMAWRAGREAFGIPAGPVELFLGAVSLLFVFVFAAYAAKVIRRPGVVPEDLNVLPGRAGLAAMTMCTMFLAAVIQPYARGLAEALLIGGFAAHVALAARVLVRAIRAAGEFRSVTPVWHLVFVGIIVFPIAAVPLGLTGVAKAVVWISAVLTLLIWAAAIRPLLSGKAPPPLRPLQAIHLAPAALVATGAYAIGETGLATVFVGLACVIFLVLAYRVRWLTEAGFSGFWGAFTFPAAAFAGVLFRLAEDAQSEPIRTGAGLVLIFATLLIPPIAFKIMQLWAKGALAAKTNAAEA